MVVALLACAVVASSWMGLRHAGVAAYAGDRPAAARHVTVRQGETLWGIASRLFPHDDPRDMVRRIIEMNGVGPDVAPGEVIVVPQAG